jgi:hypothetical protein
MYRMAVVRRRKWLLPSGGRVIWKKFLKRRKSPQTRIELWEVLAALSSKGVAGGGMVSKWHFSAKMSLIERRFSQKAPQGRMK